jgi:hypothetical protein
MRPSRSGRIQEHYRDNKQPLFLTIVRDGCQGILNDGREATRGVRTLHFLIGRSLPDLTLHPKSITCARRDARSKRCGRVGVGKPPPLG